MLGSFGLEGVLLSFHSNHSFTFLFLFFLVVSFSGRSWRFLVRVSSSAPLAALRRILWLIPDFRYLEIFFQVFDLLIDVFSLAYFLKELIEVPFLLNASFNEFALLDGLYQVFQYSVICLLTELAILWFFAQSRYVCYNTLSFDLFLLAKRESGVMLVLFR